MFSVRSCTNVHDRSMSVLSVIKLPHKAVRIKADKHVSSPLSPKGLTSEIKPQNYATAS